LGSASPHSYDLGISRTTLFWTAPITPSSVEVNFDEGEAELEIRNYCVLDAFTIPNSVDAAHPLGHPVAAVINCLKMRWSGIKEMTSFTSTDPLDHFAGDFIENSTTMELDVTTLPSTGHGFHFVSDPPATTITNFAQIGKERNGKFAV
jgi:hypothetical protein